MKILLLYPFLPHPSSHGTAIWIYNYLKNMSRHHQISLCCFVNQGERELVKSLGPYCFLIEAIEFTPKAVFKKILNLVFSLKPRIVNNYFSRQFLSKANSLIKQNHYDIIHFNLSCWVGEYINHIEINDIPKTILYEHDIIFETTLQNAKKHLLSPKALIYYIDYLKIKKYQLDVWKKFNKIITANAADKKLIQRFIPSLNISVIPNGVDTNFLKPIMENKNRENILIFVGNYWHYPNEDAIIFFLKDIYKIIESEIKDVKLLIIGRKATDRMKRLAALDPTVEIKGYVSDIRPYLSKASVFIAPIKMGGGMRGKILEAMAMGIPVVSTSLGMEGIEAVDGIHAYIADNPDQFAYKTIELLQNKILRDKFSSEGRKLVENKYDWSIICANLDKIYEEIMA